METIRCDDARLHPSHVWRPDMHRDVGSPDASGRLRQFAARRCTRLRGGGRSRRRHDVSSCAPDGSDWRFGTAQRITGTTTHHKRGGVNMTRIRKLPLDLLAATCTAIVIGGMIVAILPGWLGY